jgi:hypothetical protein
MVLDCSSSGLNGGAELQCWVAVLGRNTASGTGSGCMIALLDLRNIGLPLFLGNRQGQVSWIHCHMGAALIWM